MSNTEQRPPVAWWARIGEDWWAVVLASVLIVLVAAGVLADIPW